MARYNNILETIGNTPLVRLNRLPPKGVNLFVKVESFNPMGSVKDRMARAVIEQAEKNGNLTAGQTVIDATSGNTGIGLAMVCAQKGYPLVVTMAENFSIERRKMLRFLGAKVVLTPASQKGTGMLNKAEELAEEHGWYLCRQFDNEANPNAHTATTALEILRDFESEKLGYFVSGFGTGGTILGTARGLKAADSSIKIVAAEPDNAQVLGSGIPQPKDASGAPARSHPYFRPHLMQGWSPDFISSLTEVAATSGLIDEVVPVSGDDAMNLSRRLAQEEGIFVGTSSGATLSAALIIAEGAPAGSNIVCMLPDTGERYLSTPLFEDIGAEMNAEEEALSCSTPGYRFDVEPACTASPTPVSKQEKDPDAERFVQQVVAANSVVMFALEWCEFCWSVKKLFAMLGIDYCSVDLDSVRYQEGDRGVKVRAELQHLTGTPTIPQVFIGGEHVGGASDLFDAIRDGSAQIKFDNSGVSYNKLLSIDPYGLMPKWLQPRKSV